MTLDYLRLRMANQGACDAYTRLHQSHSGRWLLLRDVGHRLMTNRKLIFRGLRRRGQTDLASIDAQLETASLLSQLGFTLRYVFSPRFREFVHKTNWIHEGDRSTA